MIDNYEDEVKRVGELIWENAKDYLFRPVTQEDTDRLVALFRQTLVDLTDDQGYINSCKVICDETNNSPRDFEDGLLNVWVFPPPTIDKITLTLTNPNPNEP